MLEACQYLCLMYLKKGYKKPLCAKHPSFSPLTLPSHRVFEFSFFIVLCFSTRIIYKEDSAFISGVQIHSNIAHCDSEEMPVHPYRETCFDSWRLLAVKIISLYCLNMKRDFQNLNTTAYER